MTEGAFDNTGLVISELGGTPLLFARTADGGVRAYSVLIDGEVIELTRDPATGLVRDSEGSTWDLVTGRCIAGPRNGARFEAIAVMPSYWFAWSSFYPDTQVIDR